jgi:putative peptidoglycan lipid II flippase
VTRVARNTAIFSIATGLSRLAGLIREIVARSYFGTSGAASAFTIAFQIPNLVRSLFADAALSAAFVPVFTELLEKGERKQATKLASTLLWVIIAVLGAITALFILTAGLIMPLFISSNIDEDLVVGLSQVLFPIVILLGVNGLVVGILNANDHFTIPALSPLLWNAVIIASLIFITPLFDGVNEIYAYAIGVLLGTLAQLLVALPVLRRIDVRLSVDLNWRDARVKQVFILMIPVTLGLGIINFEVVLNSLVGSLVSEQVPAAIDAAFRLYMLPQGMFSVAVATVLFPALSRFAARGDRENLAATAATGSRQIFLLLVPSAVFMAVLSEPIIRLVYERGAFDAESTDLVAKALFWFCFSLPFTGVNLLLTRSFFSLQRPWRPTALAVASIGVNAVVSLALYREIGIAGPVIGTAVASAYMMVAQTTSLRRIIGADLQIVATLETLARILAASAVLGAASYGVWWMLDDALGRDLLAQLISVGAAAICGFALYGAAVHALRIYEAQQIERLVLGRLRRR